MLKDSSHLQLLSLLSFRKMKETQAGQHPEPVTFRVGGFPTSLHSFWVLSVYLDSSLGLKLTKSVFWAREKVPLFGTISFNAHSVSEFSSQWRGPSPLQTIAGRRWCTSPVLGVQELEQSRSCPHLSASLPPHCWGLHRAGGCQQPAVGVPGHQGAQAKVCVVLMAFFSCDCAMQQLIELEWMGNL